MKHLRDIFRTLITPLLNERGAAGDESNAGDGTGSAAGSQEGQQGGKDKEEMVPVSVVQGIREELNTQKRLNESISEQLNLYRANAAGGAQGGGAPSGGDTKDGFDGMDEDDVLTVRDAKKIFGSLGSQLGNTLRDLQMGVTNPDYATIITTHLPNVLKGNPALAQAIKSSSNPQILAYALAKSDPAYLKTQSEGKIPAELEAVLTKAGVTDEVKANILKQFKDTKGLSDEAQRIIANAEKVGSASQAAGAGGGLDGATMYETMSDADLEKRIDEVKRRE